MNTEVKERDQSLELIQKNLKKSKKTGDKTQNIVYNINIK